MKTVKFLKSKTDRCRRKIVKGNTKEMRLAELQDNWQREEPNFMQAHL